MLTVVEYVCADCGTLLMHDNPVTLESMKDVHSQLCAIKRQSIKPTATQKPLVTQVQKTPAPSMVSPPTAPAMLTLGADTTISLSGTGTKVAKATHEFLGFYLSDKQTIA